MFFGFRHSRNERGAGGVLPLMFSTMGGALFLFSFYNLTQFTAAKSSADQAARKAARCLTATDPAESCRKLIVDTEQPLTQTEWFGYARVNGPGNVQLDTYQYQGQVYRESYGANYNSYEVNTGNHSIEWEEKRVRPSRFIGLLNSYAALRADVRANYERPRADGTFERRSCTLHNRVEVPFGVDFTHSPTYFDARWCEGIDFRREDPSCADLDSSWSPIPVSNPERGYHCEFSLPDRPETPEPWLLLGGSPVCHTDASDLAKYAVPSEVGQTHNELVSHYENRLGSSAVPGGVGRPFSITPVRQFMVITVYSCNPEAFLQNIRENMRNSNDLMKYFTTHNSIVMNDLEADPWGDFTSPRDPLHQSAFLYKTAADMSYIAAQDWTYLVWNRRTGDQWRTLTRKVCEWVPFEEAQSKWPEFLPLDDPASPFRNSENPSGLDLMNIPELVFTDVPSCLQSERVPLEETRHRCSNIMIAGQPGAFDFCEGWERKEREREQIYKNNLMAVRASNEKSAWKSFEKLPVDGFNTSLRARWSTVVENSAWGFSWTGDRFMGAQILNPTSVRPRSGYNPKRLTEENFVKQYRKRDSNAQKAERQDALLEAIVAQEGSGYANLFEVSDLSTLFQEEFVSDEIVKIKEVWPFLQDSNGMPVAQPRPYVRSAELFDYGLDCSPIADCQAGMGRNFENIESALRSYANSAISEVDLNDQSYVFDFTEVRDRTISMNMEVAQNSAFPLCTQFKSTCTGRSQKGSLISLGSNVGLPEGCRTGEFLDCYPSYSSVPEEQNYTVELDVESARLIALAEVRRVMPGAVFCEDENRPGCVSVDIEEFDSQARVDVSFIAPLTSPFTEILSNDVIKIHATKRELIELERLGR